MDYYFQKQFLTYHAFDCETFSINKIYKQHGNFNKNHKTSVDIIKIEMH